MHLLPDNSTSRIGERRLLRALRRRMGAVHVRKDRKGAGWPLAARDWAKGLELAMLLVLDASGTGRPEYRFVHVDASWCSLLAGRAAKR
jgi:hypothetical protein